MNSQSAKLTRRGFLQQAGVASLAISILNWQANAAQSGYPVAAFEKCLQHLSAEQMADLLAELGFIGVATTVRPKGRVVPERVEEDLPKLLEILKARHLEVTEMTTAITDANDPLTQKVLRTAAKLGIKRYRLGSWKYDLKKPILKQLEALRPAVKDLAALNKELGLSAVYQTHSGSNHVGAPVWDIYELVKDHDPQQLAIAFDIRHATVEGGLCWPLNLQLVRSHLGLIYAKDFVWKGRKAENVPLGEGMVDPKFYKLAMDCGYKGPVLLHVEYPLPRDVASLKAAFRKDLATLRGWLPANA